MSALINLVEKLRSSVILVTLMVTLVLSGCGTSNAQQQPTDSNLEAKVLEIIRQHPEVILESVQAYQKSQKSQAEAVQSQSLKKIQTAPQSIIQGSPTKGALSQKIVLVEFSDFQCPYCAKAHDTVQQFMAKHQDRVTLVYKHFPLTSIHAQAAPAAQAAWAASQQGKFWQFHDGLFENQKRLGEELYNSLAIKLDLNMERFNQDRNSDAAKSAIAKDFDLGISLNIQGTPTFFMNGLPLSGSGELLTDMQSLLTQIETKK
jgi:protein-disulfide isomerase